MAAYGTALAAALAVAVLTTHASGSFAVAPTNQIVEDSGPRKPVRPMTPCVITRISDGDTIDCRDLGRVRLIGIDAPETNQKPFGAASTAALKSLLPTGTHAELELDIEKRDQYKRVLAYAWVNGRMVNWLMMRSGWTVLLTYPPNVQYVNAFRAAEKSAREERRGLWRVDGFKCLPSEHRKQRC